MELTVGPWMSYLMMQSSARKPWQYFIRTSSARKTAMAIFDSVGSLSKSVSSSPSPSLRAQLHESNPRLCPQSLSCPQSPKSARKVAASPHLSVRVG